MEPATYDFTIYQGATWSRQMTLSEGGVDVNLTGYSARMTIRPTIAGVPIISLTSGAGGGIVLAATGPNITVTITAAQTTAMTFTSRAFYDLELVYPGGVTVDRLLHGRVSLSREVTT